MEVVEGIVSGAPKIRIPTLTPERVAEVHRILGEAQRIALAEERVAGKVPGPATGWVAGYAGDLVTVEFGGKTYAVSRFGLPAALASALLALGIRAEDLYTTE